MSLCKPVHTADVSRASLWNAWNTIANYGNCSMCIELYIPTHHKLIAMHASDSVVLS